MAAGGEPPGRCIRPFETAHHRPHQQSSESNCCIRPLYSADSRRRTDGTPGDVAEALRDIGRRWRPVGRPYYRHPRSVQSKSNSSPYSSGAGRSPRRSGHQHRGDEEFRDRCDGRPGADLGPVRLDGHALDVLRGRGVLGAGRGFLEATRRRRPSETAISSASPSENRRPSCGSVASAAAWRR